MQYWKQQGSCWSLIPGGICYMWQPSVHIIAFFRAQALSSFKVGMETETDCIFCWKPLEIQGTCSTCLWQSALLRRCPAGFCCGFEERDTVIRKFLPLSELKTRFRNSLSNLLRCWFNKSLVLRIQRNVVVHICIFPLLVPISLIFACQFCTHSRFTSIAAFAACFQQ